MSARLLSAVDGFSLCIVKTLYQITDVLFTEDLRTYRCGKDEIQAVYWWVLITVIIMCVFLILCYY